MEVGSSNRSVESPKVPRPKVTRIYKRVNRLMFTSMVEKRAKPSTSAKQGSHIQDEDFLEHEFELVDLEMESESTLR